MSLNGNGGGKAFMLSLIAPLVITITGACITYGVTYGAITVRIEDSQREIQILREYNNHLTARIELLEQESSSNRQQLIDIETHMGEIEAHLTKTDDKVEVLMGRQIR